MNSNVIAAVVANALCRTETCENCRKIFDVEDKDDCPRDWATPEEISGELTPAYIKLRDKFRIYSVDRTFPTDISAEDIEEILFGIYKISGLETGD